MMLGSPPAPRIAALTSGCPDLHPRMAMTLAHHRCSLQDEINKLKAAAAKMVNSDFMLKGVEK